MSRYLWQIREELRIFVKAEAIESNPCQDLGNTNSIIRKEPVIETLKHRFNVLRKYIVQHWLPISCLARTVEKLPKYLTRYD